MAQPAQLKSAEEIRDDILNEIEANTQITDENLGAVIRTFAYAVAQEIDGAYYATYKAEINGYILTASKAALIKHGNDFALALRGATKAVGTETFTATAAGATVSAGSLVSAPATTSRDKIQFVTTNTSPVVIGGSGSAAIPIEALNVGSAGNLGINTITQLDTNIAGIASVTNLGATTGGADSEDADTFRARLLRHIQGLSRCTPPSIRAGALDFEIQQVTLKEALPTGQLYMEVAEDLNDVPISIDGAAGTNKLGVNNNTEVVYYTGIDTATSPHRITGLTRGQESTSDADHDAGVICKEYMPAGKSPKVTSAKLVEFVTPGHVDVYIDTGEATSADAQLVVLVNKRLRGNGTERDPGYRAGGITLNTTAATVVSVSVSVSIDVLAGYDSNQVRTAVSTALSQFFTATEAGENVLGYAVACVILDVPGVANITTLTINSNQFDGQSAADVAIGATSVARAGSLAVSA